MNARVRRCFFFNTLIGITFLGCPMPLLAQTCARPEPVSELDDAPLTARYTTENAFDDIDKAPVLPHVSASDIALTTEESGAFMHYLGRYGAYLGRGLAAVTPVFDAMMLADWTTQIIHTVQDPKHDVYDDWAAALYLIPGVAGVAELAAQRHHLHQALATKLHDLNAAQAYPVTDNSRQANVYRVQIEAGFNMLTQMRQDHQFELQWAWLQLTQGAYQNWHQHLQTWVEQQMTQLTEPYEAHLYAQLYRAPYGLGQQLALREYPAACDARLLQVNINPSLYPAIRRQLHTCLDTINRNLLHPILDVIQGEHPHVNLQTWSTLAQQHRTGFNAIAMASEQSERTWWQRWPQQSRQRLSLQGWAQHWQASLTPVVNRLKNLIIRHWLANTFADVPLHHISIDVEQHTVALLDEQWCSPQFHQSRWYRIKGMATTCRIMDQVTSWFAPADVIQFDPQKSRLWQQLERLMTAPPLQIDMNMAHWHGDQTMRWYLQHYHQLTRQLWRTCTLRQRVLPEQHYQCDRLLKATSLEQDQPQLMAYNINALYAYQKLRFWQQQAPNLASWIWQQRHQSRLPMLTLADRQSLSPSLTQFVAPNRPSTWNMAPPPSLSMPWLQTQASITRRLQNPLALEDAAPLGPTQDVGWSRLWQHDHRIQQRYRAALAQLTTNKGS